MRYEEDDCLLKNMSNTAAERGNRMGKSLPQTTDEHRKVLMQKKLV